MGEGLKKAFAAAKATRKPAMPARTLKALKASVEKWRKNEKGDFQGLWVDSCPLCKLFYGSVNPNVRRQDDCVGCPVFQKTGAKQCEGTPWAKAMWAAEFGTKSKVFREAARDERIFLESLLPKETRK